ncbi:MAG: type II toxin-antitoxin system HicB family antitoxin [Chloroflexota bacterium]
MAMKRKSLQEYLSLQYPFSVIASRDGGYVITFPDLPGCLTQVESLDEVGATAEEIRTLWLETAYEQGLTIPLPSYPEEYSGKFNLRLPRSLHRELAEEAEREGVSLNQYVATLLARRDAQARVERQFAELKMHLDEIEDGSTYHLDRAAASPGGRRGLTVLPSPGRDEGSVAV